MHPQRTWIILLALAFVVGAVLGGVVGVFGFIRIVGGSSAPSQPISAPTLPLDPVETDSLVETAASSETPTRNPNVRPTPTPQPSDTTTPVPTSELGEELSGQAVFRIVPDESQARYIVSEQEPLGTVVGITDQVAGDMRVNFDRLVRSEVGTIRINVRTLQTDEPDRDDSVRFILESMRSQFEFAEFVPERVEGLPFGGARIGQPERARIRGGFTIHGTTREVTFFGVATLVSPDELRGFFATSIHLPDFGLFAEPLVMHVVSEEMILEIDFVARRVVE